MPIVGLTGHLGRPAGGGRWSPYVRAARQSPQAVVPAVMVSVIRRCRADRVRRGNKMARERMTILFDQAKKLGCLVLGTSNKTEILLGYSTVFGDNASSLNPNGDLYKQQIWKLSEHLGLPASVVGKRPSADLWPGQTSEGELGFDYALADEVLYLLFDLGLSADEVVERGYPEPVVTKIVALERANRFKRRLMLIARLSGSAVNLDREIPRD